jgi:hypothetical protein
MGTRRLSGFRRSYDHDALVLRAAAAGMALACENDDGAGENAGAAPRLRRLSALLPTPYALLLALVLIPV